MKTILFILSLITLASCMGIHLGRESSRFARRNEVKAITVAQLDSALETNRIERMRLKMM